MTNGIISDHKGNLMNFIFIVLIFIIKHCKLMLCIRNDFFDT